jgi:hypothetical protein
MFKSKKPKAKMPKGTTAGGNTSDINPQPFKKIPKSAIKSKK